MSKPLKILAFSGSLRKDSFNNKLLTTLISHIDPKDVKITYINIKDYPLPIFDEDLEAAQGMPENGKKLKKLMMDHDAFIIASPEYNSSLSGALKNVIDWTSRPEKEDPFYLVAFKGKLAAIMAASPGELGGLRGLVHLRSILGNIGMLVLPDQVVVPKAHEAFDEQGNLKDPNLVKRVTDLINSLVIHLKKLKASE